MPTYIVGMQKEQWISYEADTPEDAMKLAAINNPEWIVVGANDG